MAGICIFAASSPNIDDKYIAAAESFGRCLAEHGFDLIFGGGRDQSRRRLHWRC